MGWTQPQCWRCWNAANPDHEPIRVMPDSSDDAERCCYCGEPTTAGIYVRADPAIVPFPRA